MRQLHRVTGVAQAFEIDAFDHAAGVDVEARDDAHGYSHGFSWYLLTEDFSRTAEPGRLADAQMRQAWMLLTRMARAPRS